MQTYNIKIWHFDKAIPFFNEEREDDRIFETRNVVGKCCRLSSVVVSCWMWRVCGELS